MVNFTSNHSPPEQSDDNGGVKNYPVVEHDEQQPQPQQHASHVNHSYHYEPLKSPFTPLSRKRSEKPPNGFTRPVAVCFALNYVVGTGFLVLPYVFVQAGWLLSIVTVIVASIVADMAKDFVLVSMARAEHVLEYCPSTKSSDTIANHEDDPASTRISSISATPPATNLETDRLIVPPHPPPYSSTIKTAYPRQPPFPNSPLIRHHSEPAKLGTLNTRFEPLDGADTTDDETTGDELETGGGSKMTTVNTPTAAAMRFLHKKPKKQEQGLLVVRTHRTIELSSLSDIFMGKTGLLLYTMFLSIYMYMMLWAYTSVFAQAMAVSLPLPLLENERNGAGIDNYTVYAILFGLIVCPLSFVEVEDQIFIQITLTVLRVARLLLMIGTSLFCIDSFDHPTYHSQGESGGVGGEDQTNSSYDEEPEGIPLVRLEGFHVLLPIIIAANLMHEGIPDLSQPVRDKTKLTHTFRWTFVCTGLIYSILGASVGMCFGSNVEPSANINWESFHNPNDNDGSDWVYSFVSLFIICSPALDAISTYPLNTIALGNNLMDIRCHHSNESNYSTRMAFRMVAAIPPMIGALFVRDLGIITDYAGTAGIAVTCCMTSAMFIGSSRMFQGMGFPTASYYDSYGTKNVCAHVLLWFGVGLALFVLHGLMNESDFN